MEESWAAVGYKQAKERLGPVLITFPRGNPPEYFFEKGSATYTDFHLYANQTEHKTHQQTFFGENEKWAFKGVNYGRAAEFSQSSRYALGLLDRSSGKMTLTDFEGVFSMEQIYKPDLTKQVVDKKNVTNEELRSQLIESFGTKKTKQRFKSAKNREIDESAIAGKEKITKSIKEKTELDTVPMDEVVESQRDHLPPFNLAATEQVDIYPLSQLLSEEVMDELDIKIIVKSYKKPKLIKKLIGAWDRFSISLLDSLSPDEPERLKAVVYLNALLRFYKKPRVISLKSEQWPELLSTTIASETVATQILQTFFQETKTKIGTKYQRSKTHTDKLISYILVLVLSCSNFVVDPSKLAEVLKLSQTKVVTYLRSVGCRPTANNTYTLRAPLVFPTTGRRRR